MKKLLAAIFFLFPFYTSYSAQIIDPIKDLNWNPDEIINPIIIQGAEYNILKLPKKFLKVIEFQGQLSNFYVMYEGKLTHLQLVPNLILDLSYLRLVKEDFEDISFEGMGNIKQLLLQGNFFETLPATFCELAGLDYLDLTLNIYLKKLPKSLNKLINLKTLNCCLCISLSTLPECINQLKQLNELNLEYTPVAQHPDSFIAEENKITQLYVKSLGEAHSAKRAQTLIDLFKNANVIFSNSDYIENDTFLKSVALCVSAYDFSKENLSKLLNILKVCTPFIPWAASIYILYLTNLEFLYFGTYRN